ncbi:HEPN domain-containing protein [Afipia sp. 1NLS2]|uniref:HEPN domain-containing protein n=1 Tax=Afipia sp. 1NLS2 TaxID=666684 RepID=UPI0001D9E759|nr:HEPN domain-containing protein [Afipia sp. 1NLS2]EFI50034.1 hypothetical protein AfiDRAFT_3741 [Afipia sp. 1NLS2]
MHIQGKKHLAEALQALSGIPKEHEGRISWESGALERGTFELIYNLTFTPSVEGHIKDGAIWHALNECARGKDFSAKFFIQKIRAYLKGLLSKEPRSFIAVAQINAQLGAKLPKRIASIDGTIDIRASLPPLCVKVISKLDGYERSRLNLHTDFNYMTIKVTSTSERSAVDAAYRNMKYALGVINLAADGYGVSKRFGFPNAPIGKFLSASPIFIIDTVAAKLGNWQSENHYPSQWKRNFSVWQSQPTDEIAICAKHITYDLSRIDFKERLIQSVLQFQEGLETSHIETALLKFWTGIELLCSREEKEPSERIVERASSIFDDHRHAAMRLNFIQEFRNRIVHRGEAGDHALLCAQYGSLYLGTMIRFFLWNRFKFRKRETILDYLSAPLDEKKLLDIIFINRKRLDALRRRKARIASHTA